MSPTDEAEYDALPEGVHGFTLGADGTLSIYLVADDRPALIETGVAAEVEQLLAAVEARDVDPATLAHVVVSHIHLDHAGGAAGVAEAASGATVYLHESTVRHLVDPTRLVESSREVLGESFEEMGAPAPLERDRIRAVTDEGLELDCGGRQLVLVHTPGHAPDHTAVWDPESRVLFANEAIGRYYPKADRWVPPITVPRFSAEDVRRSLETLRSYEPEVLALSHVGTRPDPDRAFDRAARRLEEFVDRIPRWYAETDDVGTTADRVGRELLDLGRAYPDDLVEQQAEICTHGVLLDAGLLE